MVQFFLHAGAALLQSSAWVRRALLGWCACAMVLATPLAASAHGVTTGELLIDHPYAVPSAPGDAQGKAYFRAIKNAGTTPERLLGASSPAASQVELHRLTLEAGHAHSTRVESIALPPNSVTLLRHTGDYQLTLIDLKRPLKTGERLDVTLNFEHAGHQTVQLWVQTPRAAQASHSEH